MRTTTLFVALLLLALTGGWAWAAVERSPQVPPVVRSGEQIVLDWCVGDPEIEELELELSVDGGPWRRISPELPGLTRRYVWRVPDLAAEKAHLRLRVGSEHGERDLPPSASFRIVTADRPMRPLEPRALTGEAAMPGSLGTAPPSLHARDEDAPAESPPRSSVSPRTTSAGARIERAPARLEQPERPGAPTSRLRHPLRN